LYVDFLADDIKNNLEEVNKAKVKRWNTLKSNLMEGISCYKTLFSETTFLSDQKETILSTLRAY